MTAPLLWHYTCDHGRSRIGHRGTLLPATQQVTQDRRALLPWSSRYVWLTDLETPVRDALGLTSHMLVCDRTAHRYRALATDDCARWLTMARDLDAVAVTAIESAPGTFPAHWWVSASPVPVVYDPVSP